MNATMKLFMAFGMVIKVEKEGYVVGFWVENFGEIEMTYYPEYEIEEIRLKPEKCYYLNEKVLEQMEKIYNIIEKAQEGD